MKQNLVAAGVAASVLTSCAATAQTIDPVYLRTDFGVEGNGARFMIGGQCMTVTAGHVIQGSRQPLVVGYGVKQDRGLVHRYDKASDLALVLPGTVTSDRCPALPTADASRAALSGRLREVWQVNPSGNPMPFRVGIEELTTTSIRLNIAPDLNGPTAPKTFAAGMSGAVVVFDGIPIAVLQTSATDAPTAEARLLSSLPAIFPDVFAAKPGTNGAVDTAKVFSPSPPPKSWAPFDADQLPPEIGKIVLTARLNKIRAQKVAEKADEVRRRAEDAASIAKQFPKGQVTKGYSNFDADNGNEYAGEVRSVGVTMSSAGYGVVIVGKGTNRGDTYYCRFVRDTGCEGISVVNFGDNESNASRREFWKGSLTGSTLGGVGHLRWVQGWGGEAWGELFSKTPTPAVWRESDGRLYEGELTDGTWGGLGVVWSAEGKVIVVGRFASGKFVGPQ